VKATTTAADPALSLLVGSRRGKYGSPDHARGVERKQRREREKKRTDRGVRPG
jgi:hypothetical protein